MNDGKDRVLRFNIYLCGYVTVPLRHCTSETLPALPAILLLHSPRNWCPQKCSRNMGQATPTVWKGENVQESREPSQLIKYNTLLLSSTTSYSSFLLL